MRHTRLIVLVIASLALPLAGCAYKRSVVKVEADGDAAYEAGEYAVALTDYDEYARRVGPHARIQYKIGRTHLAMGKPNVAVEHLWLAHELAPGEGAYLDALCEALLADNQREELYRLLRMQVEANRTPDAYMRLGYYAAKMGDPDEALPALLTAASLDQGRSVEPQMALADFYLSHGDRERGLMRLRMALYVDPRNERVHEKIRQLGETPGPSFALVPEEAP